MTTDEIRMAVAQYLAAHGIEYSAQFVPQSASRNAGDKAHTLNWRITLKRSGAALTTDYMEGIGHLPGYSTRGALIGTAGYWKPDTIGGDKYISGCCESGKYSPSGPYGFHAGIKIPAPNVADVLHSLCLDAEVLNYCAFEDWASEFGYETDSRKAEGIYRECISIALKLRTVLGNDGIAAIRAMMEEY